MKSLLIYRSSILFSLLMSISLGYIFNLAIMNGYIDLMEKSWIKDLSLALLSFSGIIIGFLLTIVSILSTSNKPILEKLRTSGHYKHLIGITLLNITILFIFCIANIIILVIGYSTQALGFSVLIGITAFPLILMLRLLYIYYLILPR